MGIVGTIEPSGDFCSGCCDFRPSEKFPDTCLLFKERLDTGEQWGNPQFKRCDSCMEVTSRSGYSADPQED